VNTLTKDLVGMMVYYILISHNISYVYYLEAALCGVAFLR
jgi:hypothetical protein